MPAFGMTGISDVPRRQLIQMVLDMIKAGNLPPHVYHGTDERALAGEKGIANIGLMPRNPWPSLGPREKPRVYFSPKPGASKVIADEVARAFQAGLPEEVRLDSLASTPQAKEVLLRTKLGPLLEVLKREDLDKLASSGRRIGAVSKQMPAFRDPRVTSLFNMLPYEIKTASDIPVHRLQAYSGGTWMNLAKAAKIGKYGLPIAGLATLLALLSADEA